MGDQPGTSGRAGEGRLASWAIYAPEAFTAERLWMWLLQLLGNICSFERNAPLRPRPATNARGKH
eukprot:55050-Prymnesium_polylepis.1